MTAPNNPKPKTISHIIVRPGHKLGDPDVEIPVAEDLVSTPGIPLREVDVSFYARVHPLKSWKIEKGSDQDWAWLVYNEDVHKYHKEFDNIVAPSVKEARKSGDLQPTGSPDPNIEVTEAIRQRAREVGFGEVGFTKMDRRYIYKSKKSFVKFSHAICLAWEQNYKNTQKIIGMAAEHAHYNTYPIMAEAGLLLGEFIRSLGYQAQIHHPIDSSCPYIPLFVNAGLGQLGANGQLLSPHFGSRARLMILTTQAPVSYDEPIDYGIHKFCDECQVCVQRCPAKALVREKVWWRGALKNKVIYDRCRPIMTRYDGCGVCMKVCPIQKFGMKPVMEHYVETGKVLGKGTDDLEGYPVPDKGYFPAGQLPRFDHTDFEMPKGSREEWAFEKFKDRLRSKQDVSNEELVAFGEEVKRAQATDKSSLGDA